MIGPFGMVVGVMGLFKEMVVDTAKVFAGSNAIAEGDKYAKENREEMKYRRTSRGRLLREGDFAHGDPDKKGRRR